MSAIESLLARPYYVAVVLLLGVGLFVVIDDPDPVKKVVGLNVFQTGVFLFFVAGAFRTGGRSPLVTDGGPYVNPLPHVLVLTAIVVGVSLNAVALALLRRIDADHEAGRTDGESA